jgi:hypothetical protein
VRNSGTRTSSIVSRAVIIRRRLTLYELLLTTSADPAQAGLRLVELFGTQSQFTGAVSGAEFDVRRRERRFGLSFPRTHGRVVASARGSNVRIVTALSPIGKAINWFSLLLSVSLWVVSWRWREALLLPWLTFVVVIGTTGSVWIEARRFSTLLQSILPD